MVYILTEKQIEDILEKGNFDKEKYLKDVVLIGYTAKDVLDEYSSTHVMPLIKDKNVLYNRLLDESAMSAMPYRCLEQLEDRLEEIVHKNIKEIEDEIEHGKFF